MSEDGWWGRRCAVIALGAGLLGLGAGGLGGALAAGMVGGLGAHRWCAARRRHRQRRERATLLDAMGVLCAELRAGAHPATAAASAAEVTAASSAAEATAAASAAQATAAVSAAQASGLPAELAGRGGEVGISAGRADGGGPVHRALALVAVGARLGADVPGLLECQARTEFGLATELRRLSAAWRLAERHGVALADLLDAVRADLDARSRLAGQIGAQLAGPRSTSAVLAGLPVIGILLGQGIGADPWRVLTGTPVGQLLLVLGTGLGCAGVAWSARITARAVPG